MTWLLQELQNLPRYPSEILPLFLYLGERCHAYNAAMNYDLKIHAHISLGVELESAYPGAIAELHYDISDEPRQDLLSKFDEIFEFLGKQKCAVNSYSYWMDGKQYVQIPC